MPKGKIYACETECPHQGAPLSGALIKDAEHITCQRHGYRYNLKTGLLQRNSRHMPSRCIPFRCPVTTS